MVGKVIGFLRQRETAEDPVCHMDVYVNKPPGGIHEHEGTNYYFCGPGCRVAFAKEPDSYLSGEKNIEM